MSSCSALLKWVYSKEKTFFSRGGRKHFLSEQTFSEGSKSNLTKLPPVNVCPFHLTGKPELRLYIEAEMQIKKCLYHDVDHYVTSVLTELCNNEPNLSKENPMMSELLNHIINRGQICSTNFQFTRKRQNRKYSRKKKDISKESDCTVSQILDTSKISEIPEPSSICPVSQFENNTRRNNNRYK